MCTIYEKLSAYSQSDYYGFHMPGHKRHLVEEMPDLPYHLDITEIEGFDDLHHAQDLLLEAQERAADLYGAEETHYLINGSTAGILSAIAGVTRKGDTILVARNCHKSVYHAIYMNELNPVYLYPGFDSDLQLNTTISAEDVRRALEEHPTICAVVIVSPTYDGVVSDVEAVAEAAHERGIPLIVDEAHGAHFGFHPYFPENANAKGADIVIHSLHKTLPAPTQTALIHLNGSLVDRTRVKNYLHMLQTSSPSYLLMAGIDGCVELLREKGAGLFDSYAERLKILRRELEQCRCIQLAKTRQFDPSKLVLSVCGTGMSGRELYFKLLKQYHLQLEMAAGTYALAMTSIFDSEEGYSRLVRAVKEIDEELFETRTQDKYTAIESGQKVEVPKPEVVLRSWELTDLPIERRKRQSWKDSVGAVALEYAYLYPPGIPVLVPGERISQDAADVLQWYQDLGFSLEGPKEEGQIEVFIDG